MGMLAHSSPCSCKHGTVAMVEKHLRVHENKRTAMFSQHLGSEFPAPGKKNESVDYGPCVCAVTFGVV